MSFDSSSHSAASSSSANSTKKRSGNPSSSRNASALKKSTKKSPFADFGSYMVEKNRKLREQFDADASTSTLSGGVNDSAGGGGIFDGVSIFVDGFTVPSSQELKGFMLKHGGRFENYFSRQRVTHIICSNLPDSKMKNLRAFSRGLPVVKPAWILESVVANKLLNWVPYQLSEMVNESGKQRKLASFFARKSISSSTDADNGDGEFPCAKLDTESPDASKQQLPLGKEYFSNCERQDDDESVCLGHERISEEGRAKIKFTDLEDGHSVIEASDSSPCGFSDKVSGSCTDNDNCSRTRFLGTSNQHHSTLGDPNFVENYFKNSRLHFIGTWRNRYRKRFCNKPTGINNVNVKSISTAQKALVIHIDMDCFFVSVVIRNYPELADKPVAVCHSDSPKGTAEISSANYPAREYGVEAGMFMRDAKARCPQLVIVPYDFEAYEEVADQFYSILHKNCNKVQAVSCDEAFLNVTESANSDPENLALIIRKEIAETTRCTASAGIAKNMLLARLATRSAKPNGQCFISPEKVDSYLKDLPINVLPGIGPSLGEKLKSRKIHTCGQLRGVSKETLHKDFGPKTGDMLWNYCRGVDNRLVEVVQETKSVGAEVNWGVRFNDIVDCEHFLLNLCKEVSFRLHECGVEGRTITLKVKKKREGAEEPTKFMGCGDCESMSRSMTLPLATDETSLLERVARQIFTSFHIDVKDVRGVGLQISRLETAGLSSRGRGKNALESWLASYGKTTEKGKETTCALNLGGCGEPLGPERKNDCRCQQNDADCQQCCINENLSSGGTAHIKQSSAGSHENRTMMLPALCHLDTEVIKNLPPEIFSEMNDMYNGKLFDFMKKYTDEEGKMNANAFETPLEGNEMTLSSGYKKKGSAADGNMTSGETACLKPFPDTKNKGKRPLCSLDLPFQSEALVEEKCRTFDVNMSNQNLSKKFNCSDTSERAQTDFGNASMDPLEKFPGSGRTQTAEKSKIDLWLGKPPKWVGLFRISNSLVLNVVADMYAKSGKSCNLSSVLQSLFSCYPPNFDLTSEGRDEALSSLCELIVQYIDLKIESDIEELYICFRLLKRFASASKFLLEVYNIVLPLLQVCVNEQYGGQLQLSFNNE